MMPKPSPLTPDQLKFMLDVGFLLPKLRRQVISAAGHIVPVLKGNGLGRPAYCSALNYLHQVKVDSCHNSPVWSNRQFRDLFFRNEFGFTLDLTGFFAQIPLEYQVAHHFGVYCMGKWYVPKGLPQGWMYSSAIAQTVVEVLCSHSSNVRPYQDNVAGAGETLQDTKRLLVDTLTRFEHAGAIVKQGSIQLSSRIVHLGVEYCLTEKGWHLSPKWAAKAAKKLWGVFELGEKQAISLSLAWVAFGICLWTVSVFELPFSYVNRILAFMSQVMKGKLAQEVDWQSKGWQLEQATEEQLHTQHLARFLFGHIDSSKLRWHMDRLLHCHGCHKAGERQGDYLLVVHHCCFPLPCDHPGSRTLPTKA